MNGSRSLVLAPAVRAFRNDIPHLLFIRTGLSEVAEISKLVIVEFFRAEIGTFSSSKDLSDLGFL